MVQRRNRPTSASLYCIRGTNSLIYQGEHSAKRWDEAAMPRRPAGGTISSEIRSTLWLVAFLGQSSRVTLTDRSLCDIARRRDLRPTQIVRGPPVSKKRSTLVCVIAPSHAKAESAAQVFKSCAFLPTAGGERKHSLCASTPKTGVHFPRYST